MLQNERPQSIAMSDANFNAPRHTGTKPRLSLLSSKQSGIRLKSEDDQQITIISSTPQEDYVEVNTNPAAFDHQNQQQPVSGIEAKSVEVTSSKMDSASNSNSEKKSQTTNGRDTQVINESKMNISKDDLIRLLAMLKSELQSKEIALASLKCEQLKRLINPVEISRSSLANTYIELQDRFKARDLNNNDGRDSGPGKASSEAQNSRESTVKHKDDLSDDTEFSEKQARTQENDQADRESLNILNTLLELLDRHPLLALPRDSIYCLDYNCNELSTKNYLNLKIQHLDELINQHRRFRYYMNERLKKSEQRYLDLILGIELDRKLKNDGEKSSFETGGRSILLRHIDQLKDALEKEKQEKQVIVTLLLNKVLDERERADELARRLADYEFNFAEALEKINSSSKTTGNSVPENADQPATKPQVPAKPARLLDQHRSLN